MFREEKGSVVSLIAKLTEVYKWNAAHEYIVAAQFNKTTIANFVRNSKIILRNDAEEMMQRLHHLGIPLIVFSAGIGNIIEMFLQQKLGQMPTNIHIISNMMNFNDKGIVESFSQPLIHTFNKNSSVIPEEVDFFHKVRKRIGFYNSETDNLLNQYLNVYDIVLVRDQTMDVPDYIVQIIAGSHLHFV
ncbi:unnamed protein product [Strongylus vulgaris]|uniref:5'-nucleotidase n=1 Tax=Strongylus vulgaris TaxID=40348 RepID=A0A3P7L559_STRVU|nr:unnamed protein product [Strongylus vulgaris]